MTHQAHPIVSFDDDDLVLVDEADRITGYQNKASCHDGMGLLHRAFSVFLFDAEGRVLLQQRSDQKRLWPAFWANSCCSHPRPNENLLAAAERRTAEELDIKAALHFAYKFIYHASFGEAGSEHEMCAVYIGRMHTAPRYNANEIAATQFLAPEALDAALLREPHLYTPWLKLEWPRLRRQHWQQVERL